MSRPEETSRSRPPLSNHDDIPVEVAEFDYEEEEGTVRYDPSTIASLRDSYPGVIINVSFASDAVPSTVDPADAQTEGAALSLDPPTRILGG